MKHKRMQASITVEMLYIMPVIFLVFLVTVYIGFYYHDRNVLQGITYEAVVIGSESYRTEGTVNQDVIYTFIVEKSEGRLLFFPIPEVEIDVTEESVVVNTSSENGAMVMEVRKEVSLTNIESNIREVMRLEEMMEGILDGE